MLVLKVFSACKTIYFQSLIKSQILPELISLWCLYYNIWTRFYVLEESEVVTWKGFIKKVFFNIPRNSQENICNKAAGWMPITSLNTESGTGAFLWIFWNLYKNIYIAKVCKVTPLKSKTFTGVSFPKILGFYFKRKRQLFYYEGTLS